MRLVGWNISRTLAGRGWRAAALALVVAGALAACAPAGHTSGRVTPTAPVATLAPGPKVKIAEVKGPGNSGPDGLAIGPDGNVWFIDESGGGPPATMERLTPAGDVSGYALPDAPGGIEATGGLDLVGVGIVVGADGTLWFAYPTLYGMGSAVGRITTQGTVTIFPVQAKPEAMVAGPDGAIWFADASISGHFGIDRLASDGTLTRFPTANLVADLAVGPDGALWFTEAGGGLVNGRFVASDSAIGRLTTGGTLAEHALPNPASDPDGIAAGPDGALWFTERGTNRIGRMTTGGSVREYAVPGLPADPQEPDLGEIAAGGDGALWITEYDITTAHIPPHIVRITTRGQISEYGLPSAGAAPADIVRGPDGSLWFADLDGNQVGHVAFG